MDKLFTITMYVLWIATIIALLAITFTSFQYEDLNAIAVILFGFAVANSFLASKLKR